MVVDRIRYLNVGILQLDLLLQDLLLRFRICLIWNRAVSLVASMANNCVPLLGRTRTLWRPSITNNSVPVLWQSVRWQLQQLAADLVRYWVVRILQLAVLLQDFLPKLNTCLLWCGAIYLEAPMANNCVSLLRSTGTMWRPFMTLDSVPMLRHSVRWQLQ